jgi:hypothetical protein
MKGYRGHQLRVFLILLGLSVLSPLGMAQTRTFDGLSYTPPSGWTYEEYQDRVAYSHSDQAQGRYCLIMVYRAQPGSGDAAADFKSQWQGIVARNYVSESVPHPTTARSADGYPFAMAGTMVKRKDGGSFAALLLVFALKDRAQSVMIASADEAGLQAYQPQIGSFITSISFGRPLAGGPAFPAPSVRAGREAGSFRGSEIAGVWMAFKIYEYGSGPAPRWVTFYGDGQVFEDIPETGYMGFDRAASRSSSSRGGYWGTYTYSTGAGVITKPGVNIPTKITARKTNEIALDDVPYERCPPVDGLRLQGSWTSYANPGDPGLDRLPSGQKPIIAFSRDGRFVDEGIFATFLTPSSMTSRTAGSGTYEIRDYTLILRYSDGRVEQVSITGFLGADLSSHDQTIYLARSKFNKR